MRDNMNFPIVTSFFICIEPGCKGTFYMADPQSDKMACSVCGREKEARP